MSKNFMGKEPVVELKLPVIPDIDSKYESINEIS